MRFAIHSVLIVFLTLLTQLGGIAWAVSLLFRRRLLAFGLAYVALSFGALYVAPQFGRTALSCSAQGPLQVQSWFYCLTNRTYVTPELAATLAEVASDMEREFPGTITLVLDGSFPFLDGFPLLPHLSHDDGEKVDLAFYYQDDVGYLPGKTRSPIGFFAFEEGPTDCPPSVRDLRWICLGCSLFGEGIVWSQNALRILSRGWRRMRGSQKFWWSRIW